MDKTIKTIASSFVELITKRQSWEEPLDDNEIEVLLKLLTSAGFETSGVVPGQLTGPGPFGKKRLINTYFPFQVLDLEGGSYRFATGWLNQMVYFVSPDFQQNGRSREELIDFTIGEIKRSTPLELQITKEGDVLIEPQPKPAGPWEDNFFVEYTPDTQELRLTAGVHKYCNGWMDRVKATKENDALLCRKCKLRVLFPKLIKTYGELRKYLTFS